MGYVDGKVPHPHRRASDAFPEPYRTSLLIVVSFGFGVLVTDMARDWRDAKEHEKRLIEYHRSVAPEQPVAHERLCPNPDRRI